jgi:hypothetical protein
MDDQIRNKMFRSIFRYFDTKKECVAFIAEATQTEMGTVWVWRIQTKNGYVIPKHKFALLKIACEKDGYEMLAG